MPIKRTLSQAVLKTYVHYDLHTGIFAWAMDFKSEGNQDRVEGEIASHLVNGYNCISIPCYGSILAHRLAFLYVDGEWISRRIGHANHDKSDDRIFNLTIGTNRDRNRPKQQNNRTGHTGIHETPSGKWMAKIKVKGKDICLGTHETIKEAVEVREEANLKYGFHENHGVLVAV